MSRRPLVVDTDPGIDDALALMYLATCTEWDLRALTVVAGNVTLDRALANTLAVATVLGIQRDVPIHAGCARPLLRPLHVSALAHGADGLGGAELPRPAVAAHPEHAVDAIIRLSHEHEGELEVITLGPLTNLGSAIVLDPSVARRVRHLTFMGGVVERRGNVTPRAEFNVHVDPDALKVVLESGIPYTMVGLDATEQALLTPDDLALLRADTPTVRLARGLIGYYLDFYLRHRGLAGCALHDPLAVAVAADPGWVTLAAGRVAVETSSALTLGETVFFPDDRAWRPADSGATSSAPGQVALGMARPGFASHLAQRLTEHRLAAAG